VLVNRVWTILDLSLRFCRPLKYFLRSGEATLVDTFFPYLYPSSQTFAYSLTDRLSKLDKDSQYSFSDFSHELKINIFHFVFTGMVERIFDTRIDVNCIVSFVPEGSFIPSTTVLCYDLFNIDI